jgi:hypothetical protein
MICAARGREYMLPYRLPVTNAGRTRLDRENMLLGKARDMEDATQVGESRGKAETSAGIRRGVMDLI